MNTMTFNLSNGKSITMAYEGTNPTTFLQTVIEKGEELDAEFPADSQVIGFTCEFWFDESQLLKE